MYVAVLEGALQRSVTVTFETTVLGSDTATGELFSFAEGYFQHVDYYTLITHNVVT